MLAKNVGNYVLQLIHIQFIICDFVAVPIQSAESILLQPSKFEDIKHRLRTEDGSVMEFGKLW